MKKTAKNLTFAAMFAAVICIATMIIKIPTPVKGYINLGDCFVLLAGWLLSPGYGFLAAAIGSGLADLILGYGVYVPATFVIKGLMALSANKLFKGGIISRIISAITAEILMILGYLIFESMLYGIEASALNIPLNAVQGAVGAILAVVLIKLLKRI